MRFKKLVLQHTEEWLLIDNEGCDEQSDLLLRVFRSEGKFHGGLSQRHWIEDSYWTHESPFELLSLNLGEAIEEIRELAAKRYSPGSVPPPSSQSRIIL